MNDFKFVSEKYSIQNTKNYRLSIQVNPDGFSVLAVNREGNILKIIHRKTGSITATQKVFKTEEDIIKLRELSFLSCILLVNSSKVILCPSEELFGLKPHILTNLEFENFNGSSTEKRDLKEKNISYNFVIDPELQNFFSSFHNEPRVNHLAGEFLGYIFARPEQDDISCYIYTTPGIMHLAIVKEGELEYYNVYSGKNNDELLYHLMNTLRILKIDNNCGIYYSGHIVKTDDIWKILVRYRKDIRILPNEFNFELAGTINENYFTYLLKSTGEDYQW